MILKFTVGFLLILHCGVSFAQLGGTPGKSALKSMKKHRWEKAEVKLRKALHKDTVNASVRYLLSTFYFNHGNPEFNLDSAYQYAITALDDYHLTPSRERERLRRLPLDSLRLVRIREKIDSAGFELAKNTNTEAAYLLFLSRYTSASQRQLATELRDEVAYQEAVSINTPEAFLSYLHRYPGATRSHEARDHYDRLLYHAETRDMRLSSFEKFLNAHPETPYRKAIFNHIFELSTADGTAGSFMKFIERYPSSELVKKARQLIFHILSEEENPQWPERFLNDSLQNLHTIESAYLVPVFKNNLYGFINEKGAEVMAPEYAAIHPDYLCGNITDDVLILDNKLITRNGNLVYRGAVDQVTELGIGFLKIHNDKQVKIIHKAGFIFSNNAEDARVLSKRYIALKRNNRWFFYTLTGRQLDAHAWDDITALQDIIIFRRNDQSYIATIKQLGDVADEGGIKLSEPFDEVKNWPYDLVWVKSGDFQGVLNQSLKAVIRFDKHLLKQTFFGATAAVSDGINLFNWAGQEAPTFEQVNIFSPWVAVKKRQSWFLFEPHLQEIESLPYDTIKAEGPFVTGHLKDTVYVHFALNIRRIFIQPFKIAFVPGKDSSSFLLVEDREHVKSLYDMNGKKLFSAAFDAIEYAGEGIFVITKKDKKGLINSVGKLLLPFEFDAIGSVKDKVVSILKSKRFGSYHIVLEKFIRPQYDRNLTPYTHQFLVTFKDGFYGFLGWNNNPLSEFQFDEIKYWDDLVALVKKGQFWNFYDIAAKTMSGNNLRNVSMIKNSEGEKIAIFQKDNNYGVISNERGVIIPPSFSDIINLGSEDSPLYFTEKHIAEASLFIVIYYDDSGKMLRKEVYDDASDYDKIYCSDN